ncbi:hypothetical protein [Flavobacterium taihuense]|uniref:Lipoprotein n=1 Tax=Flavobacterium taihuense TaxID=2857508 RepID=A0ABS6XS88_9FLAO|nr:hypothetical protein [Flavobacterium taihuense]MBW4359504.1 hypothetical protein [Flavobacterium taihuense]
MKNFKIILSFLFLTTLISCGRNEPEEKKEKEIILSETTKSFTKKVETGKTDTDTASDSGLAAAIENQISTSNPSRKNNIADQKNEPIITVPNTKEVQKVINSPLRNLLNNGQLGKSYTKKELIENYKFPKEAVDLIKQVTYVGPNKLYFKWGSTWLVEKVSDAEFENDTLIFTFKQNKTHVSGGAIGIKYNKKIYTDLVLNNGSAYIPSVKGYHWEINK